ncbi:hypothetical protein [Gracilibacillus sp. YIM 98692]|uniref:hypothetical protein n=1 Tax=Gracilibacillus sp. YIM 98692 TaxID=2663532 RepID=UPI0013D45E3A|nr:hypothetical protein [Gracilibacillus sp. YIM 98692]
MIDNAWEKSALLGSIKGQLTERMTVKEWDDLADKYGYPSSARLIYVFGSWNKVKIALGYKGNRDSFSKSELIHIAKEHAHAFTSKRQWNAYAQANDLPTDVTYIHLFGSWNKAKEAISLPLTKTTNIPTYTKDDIKKIIQKHKKHITSRAGWDQYAKKMNLPTYKTIRKHYDWEKVLALADKPVRYRYTEEQLREIVEKEKEVFSQSSLQKWNQFAKEHGYPTSSVFLRRYGTWIKAKDHFLKQKHSP